jgi:hypothetical protein
MVVVSVATFVVVSVCPKKTGYILTPSWILSSRLKITTVHTLQLCPSPNNPYNHVIFDTSIQMTIPVAIMNVMHVPSRRPAMVDLYPTNAFVTSPNMPAPRRKKRHRIVSK